MPPAPGNDGTSDGAAPRPVERKHTVIEPKPVAKAPVEAKPVQPKRVESTARLRRRKRLSLSRKTCCHRTDDKPAPTTTTDNRDRTSGYRCGDGGCG
jgi:hypothetical protein